MQQKLNPQSDKQVQILSEIKQQRLEELMARHNEGDVAGDELSELRALVTEAEALARSNAKRLADQDRGLSRDTPVGRRVAS